MGAEELERIIVVGEKRLFSSLHGQGRFDLISPHSGTTAYGVIWCSNYALTIKFVYVMEFPPATTTDSARSPSVTLLACISKSLFSFEIE